jgi:hypothetical protein
MARHAIPGQHVFTIAPLQDDFGGVDVRLRIDSRCDLQLRCRHDRPGHAPDVDITLRTTEPAMIAAHTYAPLLLVVWCWSNVAKFGRLVDVYHMAKNITLDDRPVIPNGDGTGFITVDIAELAVARAELRSGDYREWGPSCSDGNQRLARIIAQ